MKGFDNTKVIDLWNDNKIDIFDKAYKELRNQPYVKNVYIIETYKNVEDKCNFSGVLPPIYTIFWMIKNHIKGKFKMYYYSAKYNLLKHY